MKESKPTCSPIATIGDFSVLPITFPPTKAYPRSALHHIYIRRNSPKVPTPDDDRSLFLANVPADSTEAHMRAAFISLVGAGKFESITFEDERSKGNAPSLSASTAILPAQAARLTQHSKKRKRGGEGDADDEDTDGEAVAITASARMMETWPRALRRSGSTAMVLLADAKSASLVLKAVVKLHKTGKFPVWGDGVDEAVTAATHPLGSSWLRAHNALSYPDKASTEAAVDAFFTLFNRREREAAELAKRLRSEPDEDGFVTVHRGASRAAPARRDEAEEARRKMLEKERRRKEGMGNFYRFQLREQKKAEQTELVKRFEEDRSKVDAMREKRGKFRPEA